MRTYERTHPWLSFSIDLRKMPYTSWLLLGEAQSKVSHVAGVPLLPKVQEYFQQLFLAKGVLATTAIEGNTLTEEEVRRYLAGKLRLPPSKEYLGQEIDNIVAACNDIAPQVLDGSGGDLCLETIQRYNALVLRALPLEEDVVPGELRKHSVVVGTYRGAPAEDLDFLMERYCEWLNREFVAPQGQEAAFGILKAIVAHVYFAWIHPFGDGNGRTARLIEFHLLLDAGAPTIAAHLLSNFYNKTRTEYYRQLDRAHKSGGNLLPFVEYALQGFLDELKDQISLIRGQQIKVHWHHYVHERFRNRDSKSFVRRRRLVLDLSERAEPVPVNEIRHLSPRIAEAYVGKTEKTIQRDLTFLEKEMGLFIRTPQGVRARREIMLAFLPLARGRTPEDGS